MRQIKADIALLLVTIVWGSSFILMKNILSDVSSFAYLSIRFFIGAIFLMAVFHRRLKYIDKKTLLNGAIIGVLLFLGMSLQLAGLYYTTASKSAFLTGLYVVLVPIFSAVILRKAPNFSSILGVISAMAGMILLTNSGDSGLNIGDVLTVLSAICFSFQIIYIDKFTNEGSSVLLAIIQVGVTALLSTIVWLFFDYHPVKFSNELLMVLLITGVLGTAGAFTIQTVVQKYTTPTHTVLIFSAEPVFGVIFASIIPGTNGLTEVLSLNSKIGCGLILLGIIISELKINIFSRNKYTIGNDIANDNIIDNVKL